MLIDGTYATHDIRHEPYFAFISQIGEWACGILKNEVKTVSRGVVGSPSFIASFCRDSSAFYMENPEILYKEMISGFTVAIMQVPESIAFSFVAGVPP